MASFWENFAEAMGWGKANHTTHLSDISNEKKQEYRDRYADAAVKKGEKESKLNISDAKDKPGKTNYMGHGDFNSDWNSDSNYETRLYRFSYVQPTNKDVDEADSTWHANTRNWGQVLVRVPKNKNKATFFGLPNQYFKDDNNKLEGDVGVYEAYLDDGTVLDADEFKDLMYANPYERADGPSFRWENLDSYGDRTMDYYKFMRQQMRDARSLYDTSWNKNWRRWGRK